jgi:hypothetical protein
MQKHSTLDRAMAILAAIAVTTGTLILLLQDAIKSQHFTLQHALTVLLVICTISFGYLAEVSAKQLRILSALGFALLFLVGTGLVVFNSIGRQAEANATSSLSTEDRNDQRAAVKGQLAEHQRMLDEELALKAREAGNKGCGLKCKGFDASIAVYEAAVSGDQLQLKQLGPVEPVAAQAEKVADIVALFGANKIQVKALATVLPDLIWALVFEIGSVLSWGYVARTSHKPVTVRRPSVTVPKLDVQSQAVLDALSRGPCKSNDELAKRMRVSKSEASRRVKALNGRVVKLRTGKEVHISLAQLH